MRTIKKGATSQSIYVDVLDSTSTTGGRKTGLVFNTSSLVAYYVRNQNTAVSITLATLAAANTAWASGGFKEVDATNMPGIYRLDVPDAAFATGADSVAIVLKGATGMVQASVDVQLVAYDPQDAVRAGLTALPNANAEAAGGLYTRGTGAGQINQDANGRIDANLKAILGTVLTETAGQIAAGFKKLFDVATPVFTLTSVNQTGDAYARIGAAGAGLTALGDARLAHLDVDVSTRSAHSAADIWAVTTRLLSAGTNIVLVKGTGVTGFNDLSAAQVNAEADTAIADAALATAAGMASLQTHGDSTWSTADVSDLPTNAELATALAGADDATLAAIAALSSGISASFTSLASYGDAHWSTATGFATINPDNAGIAAIQERTGNLPDDPADASVIAGAFTALQSHGDGAWATGASAPTVEAIADEVQTRTMAAVTTVTERVDANIAAVNGTEVTGGGTTGNEWGPA